MGEDQILSKEDFESALDELVNGEFKAPKVYPKNFKKQTSMNKEYNYFDKGTYISVSATEKFTLQINDLWQEIKKLQAQTAALLSVAEKQREIIDKLLTATKENDMIEEIKDRLDDLESKIELIDE